MYYAFEEWLRENDKLSEFIFQMEVWETMGYASYIRYALDEEINAYHKYVDANPEYSEAVADAIRRKFKRIGSDWHWPVYPTRMFIGPDVLIKLHDGNADTIWVVARSEAALQEFMDQFYQAVHA